MKQLKYIGFAIIAASLLQACDQDFLEPAPQTAIGS